MVNIHWVVGSELVLLEKSRLEHVPRVGDEVRGGHRRFYRVVKIVWCLDEEYTDGQRANIELEKIKV
jgi:hypothetical protein